jgi:hypothetical protein
MANRPVLSDVVEVIVGQFRTLVEGALRSFRRAVPAGGLGAMEEALQTVRREVDGLLLRGVATAVGNGYAGVSLPCGCGGSMAYVGDRSKTFLTVLGELRLGRAYYRCPACRTSRVPLDETLGIVGEGQSIGIHVMTALVCALVPHVQAMDLLEELGLPHVSGSEAQRITRQVGGRAVAWRDAEAQAWATERRAPEEHVQRRPPRRLALSMDGTTVHTDGAWHEGKVGSFFVFDPDGKATGPRSYLATFGTVEPFRQLWDAEAQRWHLADVPDLVAVCDGAPWTWNTVREFCPGHTVEILDFYHATEHLWSLAHAIWGEGSSRAERWVEDQKTRLLEGRLAAFFRTLRHWDRDGPWQDEAQSQLAYFTTHRERIRYREYRACGYPIASGVIEAACKTVLCTREKQPGMRWRTPTAEAIGHLRAVHQSRRWPALRRRLIAHSTQAA